MDFKRITSLLVVVNFTLLACVKGPPQKNTSKKPTKSFSSSLTSEKVETIEVVKTLKLAAPAFKEVLPNPPRAEAKIMSLKQIYARPNSPKETNVWFSINEFQRPVCIITETQNECSPKIPKEYQGLALVNAIHFAKGYFLVYGNKADEGHLVLMTDEEIKKADYAIDFSSYLNSPDFLPPKDLSISMGINYLKLEDDILYVSYGHKTFSKHTKGNNSFLTALKLPEGKPLWHSKTLVANSVNFITLGDYLVAGYGYTSEPDFLYLLNKRTGAVHQQIALKTGPEYIVHRANEVYVRTYNTNYIFEIERQ
ncbi:MAG: hypothetical protein SGJ18_03615 [Pseudomonadota bacterium]|nr:hypothetical protein [Pseudomonadota bacterium]